MLGVRLLLVVCLCKSAYANVCSNSVERSILSQPRWSPVSINSSTLLRRGVTESCHLTILSSSSYISLNISHLFGFQSAQSSPCLPRIEIQEKLSGRLLSKDCQQSDVQVEVEGREVQVRFQFGHLKAAGFTLHYSFKDERYMYTEGAQHAVSASERILEASVVSIVVLLTLVIVIAVVFYYCISLRRGGVCSSSSSLSPSSSSSRHRSGPTSSTEVVYVPSLRPLPPQLKQPPPPPPPPPLPPQIAVSQDGEEGYALSQHLLHQNYPLSPSTSEVHHIRPPPNMTVHPRANSCGSRQPPLVVVPDLSERRRCQSMSGQRSRSTPHWTTLGRPPDYDDVVGK